MARCCLLTFVFLLAGQRPLRRWNNALPRRGRGCDRAAAADVSRVCADVPLGWTPTSVAWRPCGRSSAWQPAPVASAAFTGNRTGCNTHSPASQSVSQWVHPLGAAWLLPGAGGSVLGQPPPRPDGAADVHINLVNARRLSPHTPHARVDRPSYSSLAAARGRRTNANRTAHSRLPLSFRGPAHILFATQPTLPAGPSRPFPGKHGSAAGRERGGRRPGRGLGSAAGRHARGKSGFGARGQQASGLVWESAPTPLRRQRAGFGAEQRSGATELASSARCRRPPLSRRVVVFGRSTCP